MTPVSHVDDGEDLYRCVWSTAEDTRGLYVVGTDGKVHFGSQAFADPARRPSVDRALLRNNDPTQTQKTASAGVTKVVAGKVRELGPVQQYDAKNRPAGWMQIDVVHEPIEDDPVEPNNPAHSVIHTDPGCSKKEFHRLCEALSRLADEAGWLVQPQM